MKIIKITNRQWLFITSSILKPTINCIYFIFPFLFVLIAPLLFDIVFQTPDDFLYTQILSGAYTGKTDYHIVFLGFPFSFCISKLYSISTEIEWYALSLHILTIACYAIILWRTYKLSVGKWTKIAICFLLFGFHLNYVLYPQNTVVTCELALASAILLYSKNKIQNFIGLFLFFLGVSIRLKAALMVYAILFPIFFIRSYLKKYDWHNICKLSILVCIAVFINYINKIPYKNPEWTNYIEYNSARGFLNDNPNTEVGIAVCTNENELNEWTLLTQRCQDGTILTTEKLNKAVSIINDIPTFDKIEKNIVPYFRINNRYGAFITFFMLFFLVTHFIIEKKHQKLFIILFCAVNYLAANFYMMTFSEPKYRVIAGCVFALMLSIYLTGKETLFKYQKTLTLFLFLWGVLFIRNTYTDYMMGKEKMVISHEVEHLLNTTDAQKVYGKTQYAQTEAFHTRHSVNANKIFCSSYLTNSPMNIHYKSLLSLCDNQIAIVKKGEEWQFDIINKLLRNYYNKNVEFIRLHESKNFILIRIINSTSSRR